MATIAGTDYQQKARNTKIGTFGTPHQILMQDLKLFKIACEIERKQI
jgi:hypothetical protein